MVGSLNFEIGRVELLRLSQAPWQGGASWGDMQDDRDTKDGIPPAGVEPRGGGPGLGGGNAAPSGG
jgi:hypothetical protein